MRIPGLGRGVPIEITHEDIRGWAEEGFDIRIWRDRLLEVGDGGVCRVLQWCSKYCGTISENRHFPVVFRKFKTLQEEIGVSSDGFYGPVRRAEEAGLCLRIDVHGRAGRRQLLVLKFPEEAELHGVVRAKGVAEQWSVRDNASSFDWVLKALEIELEQRLKRTTAK